MVLYQVMNTRNILNYIVFAIICALCVLIAYKTLEKGKKRLNIIFSSFFISIAIGVFVAFFYQGSPNRDLVLALNLVTFYFLVFGFIFLTVFTVIFYKGTEIFTTSKQLVVIIIYGVMLFLIILIPGGTVVIEKESGLTTVWSFPFTFGLFLLLTFMSAIPTTYYSLKINQKFEDMLLKKKWKFFMIGTWLYNLNLYGQFLYHTIGMTSPDPLFRTIWPFIQLIFTILGSLLIYYGAARKFRTP